MQYRQIQYHGRQRHAQKALIANVESEVSELYRLSMSPEPSTTRQSHLYR